MGLFSFFCSPSFFSPPLPFPPLPTPHPLSLSSFQKAPSLESSNLERLGAPGGTARPGGRGWGKGAGEAAGRTLRSHSGGRRWAAGPAGTGCGPRCLRPGWQNAAPATQPWAQMERAAQPLQRQSAPSKQMLLLQHAGCCAGEGCPAAVTGPHGVPCRNPQPRHLCGGVHHRGSRTGVTPGHRCDVPNLGSWNLWHHTTHLSALAPYPRQQYPLQHVTTAARDHCQGRHSCRQMLHKTEQNSFHALGTSNNRPGSLLYLGCLTQWIPKYMHLHFLLLLFGEAG